MEILDLVSGIMCRELVFADDETVVSNGQEMTSFFIVERGTVIIPIGVGEEMITPMQDNRSNSVLGIDIMMTEAQTSYFTAVARGKVVMMAYDDNMILGSGSLPDKVRMKLLKNISNLLADENIRRMKKIEMLQRKNLRGRILDYLIQAEKRAGGSPFEMPDNHGEMARHLGMNRSVFSNELNILKRNGFIDFKKNTFSICGDRRTIKAMIKTTGTAQKSAKKAESVCGGDKNKAAHAVVVEETISGGDV